MINKKEFKEFNIEKQVDLVNKELKLAKGTKNFGKFELDFSYGFARNILINEGYETLDEEIVDGTKVKLFRKMNENELKEKEEKIKVKEEIKVEQIPIDVESVPMMIANDMYKKNLVIDLDKKTVSKTLPIFEDTYEEFITLLKSNEFKMYEKKYVVELMMRTFLEKYKVSEKEN